MRIVVMGAGSVGVIPLYLYPGDFNTFFDAFFESIAGFSTTGATIARRDVESLPYSIIFGGHLVNL